MEPSVAVELAKSVETLDTSLDTIIMDDDTTSIALLRKEFNPNIKKWSDLNHAKKSLTNALFKLSNKHKVLTSRKNKPINYIRKFYSYAIIQNKNNPEKLSQNLRPIVPHMFCDHASCGDWCKHKETEGKSSAFSAAQLAESNATDVREDLSNILEIHARSSGRLAPNGSTKTNESFNNVVSSKCPKNKHYSSSDSFAFRLSGAAAQKNLGKAYIADVIESKGLSPNNLIRRSAKVRELQQIKRKIKENTKSYKVRKISLQELRGKKLEMLHNKGVTYQKSIGFEHIDDGPSYSVPDFTPEPKYFTHEINGPIVYFDLETTEAAAGERSEICQISLFFFR